MTGNMIFIKLKDLSLLLCTLPSFKYIMLKQKLTQNSLNCNPLVKCEYNYFCTDVRIWIDLGECWVVDLLS